MELSREDNEEDLAIIIVPGYKNKDNSGNILRRFRKHSVEYYRFFKKILYFCSENDININVIWTI